ncbi:UNVERIFIED_CONTAM: hypothetical protein FKN15_000709 [Acipenser sinensis]
MRWWSRAPTQFGPPNWAAEQEQWRAEGAPMCEACGEFGNDREDCPYGDPQYEEAWNQGLVGDAAFCSKWDSSPKRLGAGL